MITNYCRTTPVAPSSAAVFFCTAGVYILEGKGRVKWGMCGLRRYDCSGEGEMWVELCWRGTKIGGIV